MKNALRTLLFLIALTGIAQAQDCPANFADCFRADLKVRGTIQAGVEEAFISARSLIIGSADVGSVDLIVASTEGFGIGEFVVIATTFSREDGFEISEIYPPSRIVLRRHGNGQGLPWPIRPEDSAEIQQRMPVDPNGAITLGRTSEVVDLNGETAFVQFVVDGKVIGRIVRTANGTMKLTSKKPTSSRKPVSSRGNK